jgi:hypothetical protein
MMKYFYSLAVSYFLLLSATYSQEIRLQAYGNENKTESIKNELFPSGGSLGGFDSKKGFQIGLQYEQFVYKSFFAKAEIGYLNKGHTAHDPQTNKKLYVVNYNYAYLKPSIGYCWRGLALSGGIFFNFLLSQKGSTIGTIHKTDIAYSYELSYQYKRFGISASINKSIAPMQVIKIIGIEFEHYHRWLSFGLSYALFHRKDKLKK